MRYRDVDMNAIPADLRGFDFTWSSCALEHLGTLAAGMDFVVAQMDCLAPGGVAVHTTEYLVSSNDATVEAGGTVFYRRRDIEALADRLRRAGHAIDVDYTRGHHARGPARRRAALHRRAPAHRAGRLRDHLARPDRHEGLVGAGADPLVAATRPSGLNEPGPRGAQPAGDASCSRRPLSRLWIAFVFS